MNGEVKGNIPLLTGSRAFSLGFQPLQVSAIVPCSALESYVFENSPISCQRHPDNSRRAGAGGWRDRGNPAGRWLAPSLRAACCVTDCSLGLDTPLTLDNFDLVGAMARPAR